MTSKTASQQIADEVTSWPGVEGDSADGANSASASADARSGTCTATTPPTSPSGKRPRQRSWRSARPHPSAQLRSIGASRYPSPPRFTNHLRQADETPNASATRLEHAGRGCGGVPR